VVVLYKLVGNRLQCYKVGAKRCGYNFGEFGKASVAVGNLTT